MYWAMIDKNEWYINIFIFKNIACILNFVASQRLLHTRDSTTWQPLPHLPCHCLTSTGYWKTCLRAWILQSACYIIGRKSAPSPNSNQLFRKWQKGKHENWYWNNYFVVKFTKLINFNSFDKNDKFLWKKDKCYVKCYCNLSEIFDVRNDINLQKLWAKKCWADKDCVSWGIHL